MMDLACEVITLCEQWTPEEREVFDRLVAIACQAEPALQNRMQWRTPTFTVADNWHHWLFSINKTKQGVTLSFHKGWLLDDPRGTLSGDGAHLRLVRYRSVDQIDAAAVTDLVRAAVRHQTDL